MGIVGFGLAARVFHAPFISAVPGLTLRAIVQRSGDEAARAWPGAAIVRSVEELLARPDLSLVVIATPNQTHAPLALQALASGRSVVIDKPFAATSAEAAQIAEFAKRQGLLAAPFHNRRWDGDFLTVRYLLEAGSVGRLAAMHSRFDRFRPLLKPGWKEAADPAHGLLFDLGPHLIDQSLALFGSPHTMTASVRFEREGTAVDDAFDLRLDYDRLIVNCGASLLAAKPAPRFLLQGTAGAFLKHGVDPQEPILRAGAYVPPLDSNETWLPEDPSLWGTLTTCEDPALPDELLHQCVQTQPGDYRGFYANVRDALLGRAPLAVPAATGVEVVRLLELALESARQGRTLEVGPPPSQATGTQLQ